MTHPTKPRFVAAAAGGVVQTWDLLTHTLVGDFRLPTPTPITCVAFSHDGTLLAIGGSMGVVRLCRETDSELIADFRPVKQVTSPPPLPHPSLAPSFTSPPPCPFSLPSPTPKTMPPLAFLILPFPPLLNALICDGNAAASKAYMVLSKRAVTMQAVQQLTGAVSALCKMSSLGTCMHSLSDALRPFPLQDGFC